MTDDRRENAGATDPLYDVSWDRVSALYSRLLRAYSFVEVVRYCEELGFAVDQLRQHAARCAQGRFW